MDLEGTYILIGPPGTGKTRFLADRTERIVGPKTTLRMARMSKDRSPVLICSLTRAAAAEIASRVELPKEAVATIHAHAYRSQGQPPIIDDKDIEEWNRRNPGMALSPDHKFDLDDVGPLNFEAPGDEYRNEYDLARNQMLPKDQWPSVIRIFAKQWEAFKAERRKIDYTDMLEKADDFPPMSPDVLIVDEAQDTSRLAFSVLQRWAKHCKAMIVVGDPWQALYTWAGADPSVLTDDSIEASHRGVLKQSYRVPAAIQRYAVQWLKLHLSDFKPIEYLPCRENPWDPESNFLEGEVTELPQANWREPAMAIAEAKKDISAGRSVMLVVTCNFQTVPLIKELRHAGLPFANPWRLHNGLWNPLAPRKGITALDRLNAFLRPILSDGDPVKWTIEELYKWSDVLTGIVKRGAKADIKAQAESNGDRLLTVEDVVKWFDLDTFAEIGVTVATRDVSTVLSWWLSKATKSKKNSFEYAVQAIRAAHDPALKGEGISLLIEPRLYVGTAHSFKGAEADVVYVFPDLSFAAFDGWDCGGPDRDAIARAFYVAFTRARQKLVLCGPAGPNSVEFPHARTSDHRQDPEVA